MAEPVAAVAVAPAAVEAPAPPNPAEAAKASRAWIRGAAAKMLEATAAQNAEPKAGALGAPTENAPTEAEGTEAEAKDDKDKPAEAEDKTEKKAKGKKEVTPEPPPANELEAMRVQATRLGFVVEDGKVTTAERVAFRERQREAAAQRAELEKEMTTKLEQRLTEYKPKLERSDQLTAAIEQGDHDAIAKVIGFENWDKLIEDQIARKADPNYQRLRALEESHKERARQDEERAVAEQKRQEQQREQSARAGYMQQLGATMKESKDPLVAAFSDEPGFVQTIFNIQSARYRETGEVISPEQAAHLAAPGASATPRAWLKGLYDRLTPVFGASAAAPAPAAETAKPAASPRSPAPRTVAPKAPSPAMSRGFDRKGYIKDGERRLRDAFAQDEQVQAKR